ncbi:MAG: AAA family ATPase [Candidatus Omnitrophota bacterium]
MFINEEVALLIKSKYPVVFFESIDEEYVINQLKQIAEDLYMEFYQWSITDGLRKGKNESSYYQTKEPIRMLTMILDLVKERDVKAGLFALKDFDKYLEDAIALRLFKDLINAIKNTKNTLVILAPEYKLPKDIEAYAAYIVGGYPDVQKIDEIIKETVEEFRRSNRKIEIDLNEKDKKKIIKVLSGLSIQQIRNVLNQCVLDDSILDIDDLGKIESFKKKIFDQEGLLEFCISEDKNNIADFDNLKRWLSERKDSFHLDATSPLPTPKGILLMGVHGCGKSLAIKVISRELSLPLYRLDLSKLYSKYIGETEQNLRKALKTVEKISPLCLWIDEIEKGFAASAGDIDGGVSARILGTFLTWMQERKPGCFLAATANDVYTLPPEFLRKGRFDEIFFVDLPDQKIREYLLRIHLKKRDLDSEEFDCGLLAKLTADFSGAEIEQTIISALYRASSEKKSISTEHIIEQIESTKPLSVIKREEILALRAWAKERTILA